EPTHVVAGIFGRVTSWKGQREFLEVAADVAQECPDMMFMIVGDESDTDRAYMDAVRAVADSAPLRGRVLFTGYQKNVERYYAVADIIVHNSTSSEPFGRVVIEGM